MAIPAIILAAGASRRLGRPKQLVLVEGEALLARTVRVVREAGAWPVYVVLGAHRETILAAVDLTLAEPVIHEDWEQGIATSIHAGLRAVTKANPNAPGVLLLVCDQPRLNAGHVGALLAGFEAAPAPTIFASRYAGIAAIPAAFPASQFEALFALRGDTGARALLRDPESPLLAIEFEDGAFDVDSPADLGNIAQS